MALLGLQIEGDGPLVGVVKEEGKALFGMGVVVGKGALDPPGIFAGSFDPNNVGPVVGQ